MSTAAMLIVVVMVVIAGGVLSLRSSAKSDMPAKDVLDRASRRARELDAKEENGGE